MSLSLSIGGLDFRVEGPSPVLDRVAERYGSFAGGATADDARRQRQSPIVIEVQEETGGGDSSPEPAQPHGVSLRGRDEVILSGRTRGRYRLTARHGFVEDGIGYGSFDALVRLALSTTLPLEGSLLLHAAALRRATGEGVALCGDSGAGKSTAATAFGGASDELAVIHVAPGRGVELLSTPFWRGRPFRAICTTVYCLSRGRQARLRPLHGSAAVRQLAHHVIRYVAHPEIERAAFEVIAGICARVPIWEAACPEGEAFVPFLSGSVGERAPR